MKLLNHFSIDFTFVGKVAVQLCREEEILFAGNAFQPGLYGFLGWRPIESVVNFNAIDESADVFELIDLRLRVHNCLPVWIGPACYSYVNLPCHISRLAVAGTATVYYVLRCRRHADR